MKRKTLSFILVCVTLFSASGAANFAGSGYAGMPGSAVNEVSPVRSLFAACVSPLEMLGAVVNSENPVAARFTVPQKAADDAAAAGAALLPGASRTLTGAHQARTAISGNAAGREPVIGITASREHDPPGGGSVLLFLLVFLATLYVSNLPGDAIARLLSIRPGLHAQTGFFYWGLHV